METKTCFSKVRPCCGETKHIDQFVPGERVCLECKSIYNQQYRETHKQRLSEISKWKRQNDPEFHAKELENGKKNREKRKNKNKEYMIKYRQENKNKIRSKIDEYRFKNKKQLDAARRKRKNERRLVDPVFKLRHDVAVVIAQALKKIGSSKYGESVVKYLPYSFDELKLHLENQFEWWMTWENHSQYDRKRWNDSDPSTWTWNIDHIIPQIYLPYASMEDENFQKCWALSNLRPLSAKQNILDGDRRNTI